MCAYCCKLASSYELIFDPLFYKPQFYLNNEDIKNRPFISNTRPYNWWPQSDFVQIYYPVICMLSFVQFSNLPSIKICNEKNWCHFSFVIRYSYENLRWHIKRYISRLHAGTQIVRVSSCSVWTCSIEPQNSTVR